MAIVLNLSANGTAAPTWPRSSLRRRDWVPLPVNLAAAELPPRRFLAVVLTPDAAALAKELMDYEIRVDEDANDRYGAFKVGSHDDLVTALGLACQEEPPRPFAPAAGGQRPYISADAPPQEYRGAPVRSLGPMWEPPIEELRRR